MGGYLFMCVRVRVISVFYVQMRHWNNNYKFCVTYTSVPCLYKRKWNNIIYSEVITSKVIQVKQRHLKMILKDYKLCPAVLRK